MLSRTLKAVILLCLIASLAFTGYNWPAATESGQPIRVGVPPAGSFTDEDTIFHEDFESGMGGWTTVDLTIQENYWHPDLFNAYQGNSWWCADSLIGGYDNHWLQYLVTPTLDFSNVTHPVLSFAMYYCVEDPAGAAHPYDGWDGCNIWLSIDNGANWDVITPNFPAYECQSLYSFGFEWGMGPGIPGWCGASGGPEDTTWVDARFDLSDAVGSSQVKIRFAFCSDPAYCSIGNPGIIGMFVDDVSIDDGGTNLLMNNADDPPFPSEFTFEQGPPFGDWWEMTDSTYYSPTHCMRVDDDHFYINNALVSPPISLPDDLTLWFEYAVLCDLPDTSQTGYLLDYYIVDITADGGENWEQQFHDYNRPYCYPNWGLCVPGIPYNGNTSMDLTQWGGDTIQIRFRCITNGGHGTGNGSGLHIDDVWVMGSNMLRDDVGAAALHIPFPTSLSNGSVTGTVTLTNFGLNNQTSVPAFARRDSSSLFPLAPWANIPSQQSVDKTFNWSLTSTGNFYWDAYTQLLGDEDLSNDTTSAAYVTVTPEHVYELGYDARLYQIAPFYYWSFDPGNGAMCRFVPADHSLPEPVDITQAKMMFYSAGNCMFHLFDAGTTGQPGAEIYRANLNVNVTMRNWMTVDLSAVPEMLDRTEPFWIWIESENSNVAQITGDDAMFGEGHYFTYNGSSASPNNDYEFYIRVMAEQAQGPPPEIVVTLTPENPPIQIPAGGDRFRLDIVVQNTDTIVHTFDGWTEVVLPDSSIHAPISLRTGLVLAPGDSMTWENLIQFVPGGAPPGEYSYVAKVGVYPDSITSSESFTFEKLPGSDSPNHNKGWMLSGWADSQPPDMSTAPREFILHPAHPNPFNPETSLTFDLPHPGDVSLIIYDIQGREVARLIDGWRSAGTHEIIFNGSELSSGIYFARLVSGDFHQTRKLILIK